MEPGATLLFVRYDSFGNHASTPAAAITVVTNGLVLNTNSYTTLRNLTLRGGELRALGGANASYGSYQLKGTGAINRRRHLI